MVFTPQESDYTFSEPIIIRQWSGGKGCIEVRVGYVREHPEHNQIVLFKRWPSSPGMTREVKYYIKGEEDWVAIRQAVESLWPEMADSEEFSSAQITAAIKKVSGAVDLLDLLSQYPDLLSRIPESIDLLTMPDTHKEALRRFLATGATVAEKILSRLSAQPVHDIEDFVAILEQMRLSTVNSLVNHVRYRLAFIDKFEQAISSDASFERRGDASIHNLLKANIWMLDRNYTILHDDTTLKRIIQEQFAREANGDDVSMESRPDFLCMIDRRIDNQIKQMVLIEIKRPSVALTMRHMEQLMSYKSILDAHSGSTVANFSCFLIGRQKTAGFRNIDLSASGFFTKTYSDFIGEARQFYEEYLDIIQAEERAL